MASRFQWLWMKTIWISTENLKVLPYFGLSSSWISLSFSLKQPNEQIAFKTSGSTAEADGITCVCTTSIMGSSNSSSPLPPAVTHGCLLISVSCRKGQIPKIKPGHLRHSGLNNRLPSISFPDSPLSFLWANFGSRAEQSVVCEKRHVSLFPTVAVDYHRRTVKHQLVKRIKSHHRTKHPLGVHRTSHPGKW